MPSHECSNFAVLTVRQVMHLLLIRQLVLSQATLCTLLFATHLMCYAMPCTVCYKDINTHHSIVQSPTRVISQSQLSILLKPSTVLLLQLVLPYMQYYRYLSLLGSISNM